MGLLDHLGLKAPAAWAASSPMPAPRAASSGATPAPPAAQLQFGDASFDRLALGPAVEGPPAGELWALLAADGRTPLDRSNARLGAQLNESGRALLAKFAALGATHAVWRLRYREAESLARRSEADLERMKQAADELGQRTRSRAGAYVRTHTEAYLRAQRELEDRLRALGPLEEAMHRSVSEVHTVALRQQARSQEQAVEKAQGRVDAERARVEEVKARLTGLLDVAFKVAKQNWASLAEDAAKYVGSQVIDAIPTERLDRLKQELEKASAHLRQLGDLVLLSELETAASGLRKATKDMDDARLDVAAAVAALGLAQRTAIEALGESRSTADAAQMVARKAQMLKTMALARRGLEEYLRQAQPLVVEIDRAAELYRSLPGVARMTAGVDPDGEYVRSLGETALENAATLGGWKAYIQGQQVSAGKALRVLSDTGDEGLLAHFNRVPDLLQEALEGR